MPAKKPDWRLPGDKKGIGLRWRFGKPKPSAPDPEANMSEAERLTQWVKEARAGADKKTPLHTSKPLFRSSGQAYSSGDKLLFGSGIALSLICAFFPWYVFLNQDQFGVRTVQLGDIPASGETSGNNTPAARIDAPLATEDVVSQLKLDEFTTGTLPDDSEHDAPEDKKAEPREQPFPTIELPFSLVHVANGRAMFEDESGLFVVQRDSLLPDSSRVQSIEKRDGRWVVVTSRGRVIEVAK